MTKILRGLEVSQYLNEKNKHKIENMKLGGIVPTLGIVRVGNRPDDIAYEMSAVKKCSSVGIDVKKYVFPENCTEKDLLETIEKINNEESIHGCLLFRPLPDNMNEKKICSALLPQKDIDGITSGSLAGVFINEPLGFCPCTAQAVMEILHSYNVDCKGKNAVVLGRSLVVGRPVAMLLMHEGATVTICHSKTLNMSDIVKRADIVVVATGKMESIGAEYFSQGQIVIDVGIGWNETKGKLCGDVKFDEVEPIVKAITPVPGGVGSVTTSVLISHIVEAAEKRI